MQRPKRLPGARVESWDWQRLGRCRDTGQTMFFGADGEDRRTRFSRIQQAKQVCGSCPVLSACREHALGAAEQHGIWGGLTASERNTILMASLPAGTSAAVDVERARPVTNEAVR